MKVKSAVGHATLVRFITLFSALWSSSVTNVTVIMRHSMTGSGHLPPFSTVGDLKILKILMRPMTVAQEDGRKSFKSCEGISSYYYLPSGVLFHILFSNFLSLPQE